MIKNFLLYGLLLGIGTLAADENPTLRLPESSLLLVGDSFSGPDEVKIVQQLMDSTARQLETQKYLKELMLQFRDEKESFVQGNQTKSHASKMVQTARQIYEMITANHIEYLFPKDYLEELTFFSSIAGKSGIARP